MEHNIRIVGAMAGLLLFLGPIFYIWLSMGFDGWTALIMALPAIFGIVGLFWPCRNAIRLFWLCRDLRYISLLFIITTLIGMSIPMLYIQDANEILSYTPSPPVEGKGIWGRISAAITNGAYTTALAIQYVNAYYAVMLYEHVPIYDTLAIVVAVGAFLLAIFAFYPSVQQLEIIEHIYKRELRRRIFNKRM